MNKKNCEIVSLELNGNELVTQGNFFIEAPKRFTLLEYKIIAILISKINPKEDTEFNTYRITAEEFARALNITDNNNIYKQLMDITERLMGRVIKIHSPEKELFVQTHIINSTKYWYGQGYVDIKISDEMKPHLLNLKKNFTQYKLSQILRLSSTYATRIYELMKQYETFGKRIFSIDNLKEILRIEKGTFKNISLFKTKVLEIAKREINEKTDLIIDYEFQKTGRKFTAVKFNIHSKDETTEKKKVCINNSVDPENVRDVMKFGYSANQAQEILEFKENSDAKEAIQAANEQISKGKVKRPKALIRTALQENWKSNTKKKCPSQGNLQRTKSIKNQPKENTIFKIFNKILSK